MACVQSRTSGNGAGSKGKENGLRMADGSVQSLGENKGQLENLEREDEQREIEGDRDTA